MRWWALSLPNRYLLIFKALSDEKPHSDSTAGAGWPAPDDRAAAGRHKKCWRFPDVHGDRLVFTYGGDLWGAPVSGGTAYRLTSHPGLELFPKFSPDGRSIAFTAQYGGDEQVYVMPSSGGEPRQVDLVSGHRPAAGTLGVMTTRFLWLDAGWVGRAVFARSAMPGARVPRPCFTVDLDGGLPRSLPIPVAGAGTFSDDGRHVFYSPLFRDFRTWKRYQGGWSQDLWLFDLEANDARQITDHPRTDRDPMWIDGMAYFVSDRDGKLNLFKVDPESLETDQLTAHRDGDVRWASADEQGRIVYELNW